MGLWRKQSVGNPSWGRGSEGWTQSASSQTHLKLPLHPMCFLGCLKQKGALMVFTVTLLLPNTDVIGKATAWESCLGRLGSACVSAGGGGRGIWGAIRSPLKKCRALKCRSASCLSFCTRPPKKVLLLSTLRFLIVIFWSKAVEQVKLWW